MTTAALLYLPACLWLAALALVAASPTQTGESSYCDYGSCEYRGLCFPEGQQWTDSSQGCVQNTCIASTGNGDTQYGVGTLGCPVIRPPSNGKYIKKDGDPSARYPDCCTTYIALSDDTSSEHEPSSGDKSSKSDGSSGDESTDETKSTSRKTTSKKSSSSTMEQESTDKTPPSKRADKQQETVKVKVSVDEKTLSSTSSASSKA